jgi:hypothetical protein
MKKTIIVVLLVVALVTSVYTYGSSTNWFNSARFTGNLIPDTSNRVSSISLDLGNLVSASTFNVSGSGTIVIGTSTGLNLSNILMTPHLYLPSEQRNYWLSRFLDLSVNFTLDNVTFTMPIISSKKLMVGQEGSTILGWLDYNHDTIDRSIDGSQYCYYQLWKTVHLDQGIHDISFDLYGMTNLVNSPIGIELDFVLELTL